MPNSRPASQPRSEMPTEQRKRASKPKTRTGCVTCKVRHVKCDEQKPECARCLKFGVRCDGYPILKKSQAQRVTLKIRPYCGPKASGTLSFAPLHRPPPDHMFQNELENRYFQTFRREIVAEISGIWDHSFWDNVILPGCDEPFIRDIVLAISAINLSIKESRKRATMLEASGNCSMSNRHYQFALERYGRAVRTMRMTLTNGEQHLRRALIGCLLVFCFEGFQGYPKQALVHVVSGYHLLQEWLIGNSALIVRPNNASKGPMMIENELLDTFNRLHTNAVTVIGDSCTTEAFAREQASGDQVLETMPTTFADFNEAHRYFVHVMKRCAVFVAIAVGLPPSASSSNGMHSSHPSMDWSASVHQPFKTRPIPGEILKSYYKHASELQRWQEAFHPLRLSPNRVTQIGVTVLHAGFIGIRMVLNTVVARSECYWDQFLPEFQAITSLCRTVFRIVPHDNSFGDGSGFSLDITIVPPLYIVCMFCRDPQIRREALSLMKMCPRREGVWDSGLTTDLSTFLMEVEEQGMVDGYIPEHARAKISKVEVDVIRKTADVECMKRKPGTYGEVMVLKRKIEWD